MKSSTWRRWLSRLFSQTGSRTARRKLHDALGVELLEDRTVPATFTWTGNGGLANTNWSNPANWGGAAPSGSAASLDTLVFPNGPGQRATTNDLIGATFRSISFSGANYSLDGNQITLGDPSVSNSGTITVGASLLGITVNLGIRMGGAGSDRQIFTVSSFSTLTLNGALSGSTGVELAKQGTGTLILSGNNSSYTGPITIVDNSGIVEITNANALGNSTAGTTVGTGSQLRVTGTNLTFNENLILNGPGGAVPGALFNTGGVNTWAGTITLDSETTLGGTAGSLNITGQISDLGAGHNLIKEGLAQIIFSTANTYRGTTTINDGVLTIRDPLALGFADGTAISGTIVTSSYPGGFLDPLPFVPPATRTPIKTGTLEIDAPFNGGFTVANELLTLNGRGERNGSVTFLSTDVYPGIGALRNLSGANTWTGNVNLGSAIIGYEVTVNIEGGTGLTVDGQVQDPVIGVHDLHKIGLGRLVFTRANSYTGRTFIDQGTLEIRDSQALGSPFIGGGTFVGQTYTGGAPTFTTGPATLQLSIDNRIDSITGTTNTLRVVEPLDISGRGVTAVAPSGVSVSVGALFSESGINEYAADINLNTLAAEAGIGVGMEPNQTGNANYFTNDYSLTVTGIIRGGTPPPPPIRAPLPAYTQLSKMGDGHLILPSANTYLGPTEIERGWVTIRDTNSLGGLIAGVGDGGQYGTTVNGGAALHLYPVGPNFDFRENLVLRGDGIDHPFGLINHQGVLQNLAGSNTASGDIELTDQVGIGVEDVFGLGSQLVATGTMSERILTVINVNGTASGGSSENANVIDTGATAGTITINADAFFVEDDFRVYLGDFINDPTGSILVYDSTTNGDPQNPTSTGEAVITVTYTANSASASAVLGPFGGGYTLGPVITNYAALTSTFITIVVNEGGRPGSGTVWDYSASIVPVASAQNAGVLKLGSKLLALQGEGTFSGDVDVSAGVLLAQNHTALGTAAGSSTGNQTTTIVQSGAALLLGSTNPFNAGGITAGIQVYDERLILNGPGNTTLGVPLAPLTLISDNNLLLPTVGTATNAIIPSDAVWRGPVTLGTNVVIDVDANSRLTLDGPLDDTANPSPTGSSLTKIGTGELMLSGSPGQDTPRAISVGGTGTGGQAQNVNVIDTGATSGIIVIDADVLLGLPQEDSIRVYLGDFLGNPTGAILVYDSSLNGNPQMPTNHGQAIITVSYTSSQAVSTAVEQPPIVPFTPPLGNPAGTNGWNLGPIVTNYASLTTTFVSIVVNEGGSPQPGTFWTYTANITPNASSTTPIVTSSYRGITYVGTSTTDNPGNVNEFFNGANTPLPGGILTVATPQALGAAGNGEQQSLTVGGPSGTFTLSFNGQPTSALPRNASAATIAAALNALSTIGGIGASVSVLPNGARFSITFGGTLGGSDVPLLVASGSGGATVNVTLVRDGTGGTIVQNGSQMQLARGITVAAEQLIVSGQGVSVADTPNVPITWHQVGPAPMQSQNPALAGSGFGANSGRITGVAVDPTDPDTIYVSAAGGGAWKTKNGGLSWQPLFDSPAGMFTGAIAVAPSDPRVVYLGTGEANNVLDSFYGSGVYKSVDSGRTWTLLTDVTAGSPNPHAGNAISKIVVDPTNPDRVYVATTGGFASVGVNVGPSGNAGVWRFFGGSWFNLTNFVTPVRQGTLPGGATGFPATPPGTPGPDDDWRLSFPNSDAAYSDLGFDRGILYMALGTFFGDPGNAVYRCEPGVNGPDTNQPAWYVGNGNGPAHNAYSANGGAAAFPRGNGVSAPNGNIKFVVQNGRLYAAITNPNSQALAQIVRSNDGGMTWAATTPPPNNYQGNGGLYHSTIAIDPANINVVYVAGVVDYNTPNLARHVYQTTNGGTSWQDITNSDPTGQFPHTDSHASAVDSRGRLVLGTDGGVWRWDRTAGTWTNVNGNLATHTVNGVAMHPNDPRIMLVGSQDNGTARTMNGLTWVEVDGGDGGIVRFDPKDPQFAYNVTNDTLRVSRDGGQTWASSTLPLAPGLYFPFLVDQVNPARVIAGHSALYESLDRAGTFNDLLVPLSPTAQIVAIAVPSVQGAFVADPAFPLVTDRGTDSYDADTIYVFERDFVAGVASGRLFVTKDHGQTWVSRAAPAGNGDIVDLAVDPRNRDTIYAVRAAVGANGKVFKSTDAGQSWMNISAGLPDVPTWKLVVDPRTGDVYLGTDDGVYQLANGQTNFLRFGTGLPHTQVKDLELNQSLNMIVAGTYGRSVYQIALDTPRPNSGVIRAVSGDNVWAGPIMLAGNTTISSDGTQALQNGISTASLTISGSISDMILNADYQLNKLGLGDVILSGANNFGGIVDLQEGVLAVQNPRALGTADAQTIVRSGATLELQSDLELEPLLLTGSGAGKLNGHFVGALRNISGNNTYTGTITLTSGAVIGVDSGNSLTIGSKVPVLAGIGRIDDGGANATLTKELTGTLILASDNTYGGGTQINQGVINIRSARALGDDNTETTVLDGAQLQIQNGITVTAQNLRISGTGIFGSGAFQSLSGANQWLGTVTLAKDPGFLPTTVPPDAVSIGVLFNAAGDNLTLSGPVIELGSQVIGLDKVGPGTLILNNNSNNYGGVTTVFSGVLRIQQGGALGSVANGTVVRDGAALELDGVPTSGGVLITPNEPLFLNGDGIGEVQNLSLTGTTGTFTLTFNGVPTVALPPTATAAQIQGALNVLSSIGGVGGNVSVTQNGSDFLVIFGGALTGDNLPLITGSATGNTSVTVTPARDGGGGALHNVSGNNIWSGPTTLQSSSSIGTDDSTSLAMVGVVRDTTPVGVPSPDLTKNGMGTLLFPNANTYSGATIVNEGVLNISNAGALGFPLVSEVQTVTLGGPNTGTFDVTFRGATISPTLPATATALQLQTALEQLPGIGTGNVQVSRSGSTFTVTFQGALANLDQSQITGRGFSGTTVATATTRDGSKGTIVNDGASLQVQGGITVSSENLALNGLGFNGQGALNNANGNNTWSRFITLATDASIGVAVASDLLNVNAPIVDNNLGFGVTKTGPGTLQYSGATANTYTGDTVVADGTLNLNKTAGVNAMGGDLVVGDGQSINLTLARWLANEQMPDAATVVVNNLGTADLNLHLETVNALTVNDGTFSTGAGGGTGTVIVNSLNMTGGIVNLVTATSSLELAGPVNATSSDTAPARIIGGGFVSLNDAGRVFNIGDGPVDVDLKVEVPLTAAGSGLIKSGLGTMEVDSFFNTYNGQTRIDQGNLRIDGQIGNVTLNGGTVSGVGFVGTITSNSNGGAINPGDFIGTLNSGAVTLNSNNDFFVDLANGFAQPEQLQVTGNINLANAELTGLVNPNVAVGNTFTIITTTGGNVLNRFVQGDFAFVDGRKFGITYTPTSVTLTRLLNTVTMSLSASIANPVFGQRVVFTATLLPEAGAGNIPDGELVKFTLDNVDYFVTIQNNRAVLDPADPAVLARVLSVGTHSVSASYAGNADNSPASAGPINITVGQASTTTTLTTSKSPSNTAVFGEQVIVFANVQPVVSGLAFPTGSVQFRLISDIQSISLSGLTTGSFRLTFNGQTTGFLPATATAQQVQDALQLLSTVGTGNVLVSQTGNVFAVTFQGALFRVDQPLIVAETFGGTNAIVTIQRDVFAPFGPAVQLNNVGIASITLPQDLMPGNLAISASYSGDPNFLPSSSGGNINLIVTKANTNIDLQFAPLLPPLGSDVTLVATVTVRAPGSGKPGGTVTFFLQGQAQALGTAAVNQNSGVASLTVSNLPVGANTITAVYSGNNNFNTVNSSPTVLTVDRGNASVQVTSSQPVVNQAVVFTATVSAVAPTVASASPGTVTFNFDNGARVETRQVDGSGRAFFTLASLPAGQHTLTVTYNGNSNLKPTTATLTIGGDTTTTVTTPASAGTSVFGEPVTFRATVQSVNGQSVPSGSVTFFVDGAQATGPLGLDAMGRASFTTNALSVNGTGHVVRAVFASNGAYSNSTSTDFTHFVNKANTTVTLSSSTPTATTGQPVTITATVAGASPSVANATSGTVTFIIDGNTANPRTATVGGNGQASITLTGLSEGPHSITASYGGSAEFNASSSGTFVQTVGRVSTTSLTVLPGPNKNLFFGQTATFVVNVAAVGSGGQAVTGSVRFIIDRNVNNPIVVALDANGQAILTSNTLSVGNHTIQAIYSGDDVYAASSSAEVGRSVRAAKTVLKVSAAPLQIAEDQSFTLNVLVKNKSTAAIPTGTVQFFLDGVLVQSLAIDAEGRTSYTVPPQARGNHNVRIAFIPTGNFANALDVNRAFKTVRSGRRN